MRAGGGAGRGLARVAGADSSSIFVGLSTRLGDTAADGDAGEGSPFARAFAAHMTKPGLRLDDAFTELRKAVMQETGGSQRPEAARNDLDAPVVLVATEAVGEGEDSAWARTQELAAVWQDQIGELEQQLDGQQSQVARTQSMVRRYAESITAEVDRFRADYPDAENSSAAEELARWAAQRIQEPPTDSGSSDGRFVDMGRALNIANAKIVALEEMIKSLVQENEVLTSELNKSRVVQLPVFDNAPPSSADEEWRCASITRGQKCTRPSKTFTCSPETFGWRC